MSKKGRPATIEELHGATWEEHLAAIAMGIRRDRGGKDLVEKTMEKLPVGLQHRSAYAAVLLLAEKKYRDRLQQQFDSYRKQLPGGPSPDKEAVVTRMMETFNEVLPGREDQALLEAMLEDLRLPWNKAFVRAAMKRMERTRTGSQERVFRRLEELAFRCASADTANPVAAN